MLELTLPGAERFDPATNEFIYKEGRVLHLEHSLLSISKWEAETKKSFFSAEKTPEELLFYILCMSEEPIGYESLDGLTAENWHSIEAYMNDPRTATTFGKGKNKPSRKKVTSEEIYYMMAHYSIPFECERWHFNRLMTLLKICSIRNSGPESKVDARKRQAALNAARRAKTGSRG